MTRPDRIAAAVLFILLTCARCGSHAAAQDDALLIARIGLSEAPRDTTAIAAVLAERASSRGITVRQAACSYAPRSCGRREYTARPWIPAAHPDRLAPIGWPGLSSWERTRVQLASLVVLADRALRGIDRTPCLGATEWGSPSCRACTARMRAAGFVRIDCPSANTFYGAPIVVAPVLVCGGES